MGPEKDQSLQTMTALLRHALESDSRYVICVEDSKGSRICMAGPFEEGPEGDLEQARMLERFARSARETAKV